MSGCKKGDIAYINKNSEIEELHGHFVTCLQSVLIDGVLFWEHEPIVLKETTVDASADRVLTPLKPQKSDAEDEMLQIVGYPKELVRIKKDGHHE